MTTLNAALLLDTLRRRAQAALTNDEATCFDDLADEIERGEYDTAEVR